MKAIRFLWALALLWPYMAICQSPDCDSTVADQAGKLDSNALAAINNGAQPLINEGAEVRVRIVAPTTNTDAVEQSLEDACSSWRAPNGHRKSNLVSLIVSPDGHKSAVYYGNAYTNALHDHWNRIRTDYMNPHFKTGDWAGGLISGETQLAARIHASKDEALHPASNTVVNEATDFTGLWKVFAWLVAIGAVFAGIFIFWRWWSHLREQERELHEAQRKAIAAKQRAAESFNTPGHPCLEAAQREFDRINGSLKNDPNDDALELEEYNVIAAQYDKVTAMASEHVRAWRDRMRSNSYTPLAQARTSLPKEEEAPAPQPAPPAPQARGGFPAEVEEKEREYIPVPIPIPIPEYEPSRRTPDPEPEPDPEPSRRSDDDYGGGGGGIGSSDDSGGGGGDFGGGDSGGGDSGGGGGGDF